MTHAMKGVIPYGNTWMAYQNISSLPEGQTKQYLLNLKSTLGYIAELYFFNAVSLSQIRSTQEGIIKALAKEVFKDRTITLPYEPKEGESLHDIAKNYEQNKPYVDWLKKDLEHKSKIGEE